MHPSLSHFHVVLERECGLYLRADASGALGIQDMLHVLLPEHLYSAELFPALSSGCEISAPLR